MKTKKKKNHPHIEFSGKITVYKLLGLLASLRINYEISKTTTTKWY